MYCQFVFLGNLFLFRGQYLCAIALNIILLPTVHIILEEVEKGDRLVVGIQEEDHAAGILGADMDAIALQVTAVEVMAVEAMAVEAMALLARVIEFARVQLDSDFVVLAIATPINILPQKPKPCL